MYFEAIDTGNFLRLVHILNRGIDIDIVDENGESGLLKAAFHVPRELLEPVVGKNPQKSVQRYFPSRSKRDRYWRDASKTQFLVYTSSFIGFWC